MSIDFCVNLINQIQQFPANQITPTQPIVPSRPFTSTRKSETVTLTIKPLKQPSFTVVVDPLDTIYSLKQKRGNGTLLLKGKALNDFRVVWSVGLRDQSLVHLSRKDSGATQGETEGTKETIQQDDDSNGQDKGEEPVTIDDVFVSKLKSVLDTKLGPEKSHVALERCLEVIKQYI